MTADGIMPYSDATYANIQAAFARGERVYITSKICFDNATVDTNVLLRIMDGLTVVATLLNTTYSFPLNTVVDLVDDVNGGTDVFWDIGMLQAIKTYTIDLVLSGDKVDTITQSCAVTVIVTGGSGGGSGMAIGIGIG